MPRFLIKTEPSEYSYDDLERDKRTVWSGVAAAPALIHLRAMKKGDLAFVYHTGDERRIVGIAKVAGDPYPDPKLKNEKMAVVEIQPVRRLKNPVTLTAIKSVKSLATMPLVRIGRLSVQPVSDNEWETILSMSQ